ncbi:annexin, partial [bacterium LRH843]|nr:annexin [bacterium LRH843]
SIPRDLDQCQPAENKVLFDMLSKESFEHIRNISALCEERNSNYSRKMHDYVKDFCPEDMLTEAYLTVMYYASSPTEFYAHRLDGAMIGLGTNDHTLIRIIVGRSEIDIGQIKQVYNQLFNTTLEYSIE